MKVRTDFITNSSSSGFIISKADLNAVQIEQIRNHIEEAQRLSECSKDQHRLYHATGHKCPCKNLMEFADEGDRWYIDETETTISGSTWMDNFDMCDFLGEIGVPDNVIDWDD